MRRTVLFLTAVTSAASLTGTWTESMKYCKRYGQYPASLTDQVNPNSWIGRAKYEFGHGVVYLRIETVDENKICNDCDGRSNKDYCEYCVQKNLPLKLNALQDVLLSLEPNRMFIVGNFTDIGELITDLEPTLCLVSNGDSNLTYVSCKESFSDGCHTLASPSKVILQINKSLEISTNESIRHLRNESNPRRSHLLVNVIVVMMCMSLQKWENGVNTL